MINGHGNNIYQYDNQLIEADFSSNIAFNNRSEQILCHLRERMDSLCNYPDTMATKLTEMLAAYHGVGIDNVLVVNGSTEAFYLVAHYLSRRFDRGCRTTITTPSFSEYEDSCKLYRHDVSYLSLKDVNTTEMSNVDSLWLASPNNPNGYRVSVDDIFELANKNRECVVVLDRAYNDLSSDSEECGILPENVILIESFTKFYGIPGLRLGYIVAASQIIASLGAVRSPWSFNSLSLIAGEYILSHLDELQIDLDEIIGESIYLQDAISQIDGFRVVRSKCNFFIVEISSGESASELYDYLLGKHNLLIRNCSNFRGLGDNYIRIAAQARPFNDKLISALRQWR